MTHYQRRGTSPARRRAMFRHPGGRLYYEELAREEGFVPGSALLHHRNVAVALAGRAGGSSRTSGQQVKRRGCRVTCCWTARRPHE